MYRSVDSENRAPCPSPQGCYVDVCYHEYPRGWNGHGLSWEGMPILTFWMSVGRVWTERAESQVSFFFFLSLFSPSEGIADYITRCKQAIGKFESLVHQIHKNSDDISSRLTLIESVNLFKYPAAKSEEELPGRYDFLFL